MSWLLCFRHLVLITGIPLFITLSFLACTSLGFSPEWDETGIPTDADSDGDGYYDSEDPCPDDSENDCPYNPFSGCAEPEDSYSCVWKEYAEEAAWDASLMPDCDEWFTTISAAVADSTDGSMIWIAPDHYEEELSLDVVNLRLQGCGEVEINASDTNPLTHVITIDADNVSLDNLILSGIEDDGVDPAEITSQTATILVQAGGTSFSLSDVVIQHNVFQAIRIESGAYGTLEDVTLAGPWMADDADTTLGIWNEGESLTVRNLVADEESLSVAIVNDGGEFWLEDSSAIDADITIYSQGTATMEITDLIDAGYENYVIGCQESGSTVTGGSYTFDNSYLPSLIFGTVAVTGSDASPNTLDFVAADSNTTFTGDDFAAIAADITLLDSFTCDLEAF